MEDLTEGFHYRTVLEDKRAECVCDVRALSNALPHGSLRLFQRRSRGRTKLQ